MKSTIRLCWSPVRAGNASEAQIRIVCRILSLAILIQNLAASNGDSQSWERPGCHRVGHVREISIAGCLKFNISTNACRGQCVSYSVPAFEELDQTGSPDQSSIGQSSFAISGLSGHSNENNLAPVRPKNGGSPENADSKATSLSFQQATQQSTGNGVPTGGSGTGETLRRDVVSVSQCCNMMETEDVIVNVRCKPEGIRRLVFKSAKTCECFFCKHL